MSKNISKKIPKIRTDYSRAKETQHDMKPEFLSKNPFRFVKKYKYKFDTYCKKRWRDKNILDVLTTEFSSFSPSYYVNLIIFTINKKYHFIF